LLPAVLDWIYDSNIQVPHKGNVIKLYKIAEALRIKSLSVLIKRHFMSLLGPSTASELLLQLIEFGPDTAELKQAVTSCSKMTAENIQLYKFKDLSPHRPSTLAMVLAERTLEMPPLPKSNLVARFIKEKRKSGAGMSDRSQKEKDSQGTPKEDSGARCY
jgi:hypothetical protein